MLFTLSTTTVEFCPKEVQSICSAHFFSIFAIASCVCTIWCVEKQFLALLFGVKLQVWFSQSLGMGHNIFKDFLFH